MRALASGNKRADTAPGDKVSRAHAVVPMFAQGLIYAPERDWSDMVISEMANFPLGKYDDLTDSATQSLGFLRNMGIAKTAGAATRS